MRTKSSRSTRTKAPTLVPAPPPLLQPAPPAAESSVARPPSAGSLAADDPAGEAQTVAFVSSAVGTCSKELALRLLDQALSTTPEREDQDRGEVVCGLIHALRA